MNTDHLPDPRIMVAWPGRCGQVGFARGSGRASRTHRVVLVGQRKMHVRVCRSLECGRAYACRKWIDAPRPHSSSACGRPSSGTRGAVLVAFRAALLDAVRQAAAHGGACKLLSALFCMPWTAPVLEGHIERAAACRCAPRRAAVWHTGCIDRLRNGLSARTLAALAHDSLAWGSH